MCQRLGRAKAAPGTRAAALGQRSVGCRPEQQKRGEIAERKLRGGAEWRPRIAWARMAWARIAWARIVSELDRTQKLWRALGQHHGNIGAESEQ